MRGPQQNAIGSAAVLQLVPPAVSALPQSAGAPTRNEAPAAIDARSTDQPHGDPRPVHDAGTPLKPAHRGLAWLCELLRALREE